MAKPLTNRVALVTGAGSGMGRAHCEVMAERGAHVIVQDIVAERAEAVAAAIRKAGGGADAMPGDVSDVPLTKRRVAEAERRLGHIDILINNAGISGLQKPFEFIDEANFERMMAVHVKSAFFCTQAVIAGMKRRRWGRIVNVSSMFAMKGSPNAAHYTGAKGALLGLTKAWAIEFAPYGITVNALAPGLVQTEMTTRSLGTDEEFAKRAAATPMKRLASPRDLAYAAAWLASDEAAFMTGQTVSPNGGDAIVGI